MVIMSHVELVGGKVYRGLTNLDKEKDERIKFIVMKEGSIEDYRECLLGFGMRSEEIEADIVHFGSPKWFYFVKTD